MNVLKKQMTLCMKIALSLFGLILFSGTLMAQSVKVTGKVTDISNQPLTGVFVLIDGTRTGVSTDDDGEYTINVPQNSTLVFSLMGMKTVKEVVRTRQIINVVMEDDALSLDEAVITAEFGMKRVARAVGSSVQNVKASDIAESGRDSFVSALQGRVAGITVTSSGGSPGASTTVVLRSITSISGNNQPLYVVDGIPMNNSTFDPSSGFAVEDAVSSRDLDFSSRGNDLNPEDIESMTVLKGAAAAALYGSDASNGAIIITTKKGSAGTGKVTYSNRFRISQAYGYPEMQRIYANGAYGTTNYYYQGRFGGKYPADVQLYDNIAALLQTGFSQTHNVAVEGGTDKITVRGSAAYVMDKGIVKTTDYNRLNITLTGRAQVTKWLNFDASMLLTTTSNTKARKGSGGPLYRAMRWPLTDDMSNYITADGKMSTPEIYTDTDLLNPLFALYKNRYYDESERMQANVGLNITPTKNTFIVARMGWDIVSQKFEVATHPYYANPTASAYGTGDYNLTKANLSDNTFNVAAGYNNQWDKITFDVRAGYEQFERGSNNMSIYGSKFQVIDFYGIANCDPATVLATTANRLRRVQGLFGRAEVGYNNMAFLTIGARNDWSSTLPTHNNSYFYPSVEFSMIATELPFLKNNTAVSFLKLRGAVAQVGKDASPNAILPSLEATGLTGGGFTYGYYGPNLSLKPEMTTSYEVGFEGRFLNDRINTDFTYYWTNCEEQYITGFRLSYATGFVLNNMNVGSFTTQGWDFHIDGDILRLSNGLRWNMGLNLSASSSMVTYLPENVSEYYNAYTWISGNLRNGIKVGNPVTTITGRAYERNEKGDILISPSTGIPLVDANWSVLGDRQPKLDYGISTNVSYKGFRLSALFSGLLGATVVNGTKRDMMAQGSSMESVTLRESDPVVFKGVLKNGLENTDNPTVNNISVTYSNYGSSIYAGGDEDWLEKNVNYLRLSEVRLSYNLPRKFLSNTLKNSISSANIWVAGNDLFVLTNYSGIDPVGNAASAALGGSGGVGIDYFGIPNPRGFSFGLSLTF